MTHQRSNLAGIAISAALTLALGACGSTYTCSDQRCQNLHDFAALAAACLKVVENTGAVRLFVVPEDLNAHALKGLEALRPIRTQDPTQSMDSVRLGKGEFLVRKFSVDEAQADCEGTLGPALRAASSGDIENCGTTFLIPFELEGDHWANHSYKTVVCSPDNQIIPKH
jgi:hypothetical protein